MPTRDCMTATGTVSGIVAGGVEVDLATPFQCRGCAGLCAWRRVAPFERTVLHTAAPLCVGDRVTVSLSERRIVAASLVVHGVPLAALLGGALAGVAVAGTDLGSVAGALIALGLALAATPGLRRRAEHALLDGLTVARDRTADR